MGDHQGIFQGDSRLGFNVGANASLEIETMLRNTHILVLTTFTHPFKEN